MRRRQLVAALPAAIALGTAGCLTETASNEALTDDSNSDADTSTTTNAGSSSRTTQSPEAVLDDVRLARSASVLTPTDDRMTVALRNESTEQIQSNLAGWKVFHDDDVVVPERWAEPMHTLDAGESHEYSVRYGGEPTRTGYSDVPVKLGTVESGEYAFRLTVRYDGALRTLESQFAVERDDTST